MLAGVGGAFGAIGAIMAGAGAAVAIPLVTAGVTLYELGLHDRDSEPAPNRRTRGRGLVIDDNDAWRPPRRSPASTAPSGSRSSVAGWRCGPPPG